MLQVRDDSGEALQRLDCLAATLAVSGAKRGRKDLLEKGSLTIGRSAEHPEVSWGNAVTSQLTDGAHDFAVELVVVALAVAELALDEAVVLQLAYQPVLDPGVIGELTKLVPLGA